MVKNNPDSAATPAVGIRTRLWLLPLITGGILSLIYCLPKAGEMSASAIRMELPLELGSWSFNHRPPSEEEIKVLAADTQFAKAICLRPRPGEYDPIRGGRIPDRIDLSVVLSGHDLNNSIHRPERCMPAQGHALGVSKTVDLKLPNGRAIKVKRLLSVQSLPVDETHTRYESHQCLTYYFFVGHRVTTHDHFERTMIDMKDRLFYGMDQRWAYVSASMWYGKVPWIGSEVHIDEVDTKLQEFLGQFAAQQIKWDEIK